MAVDYKKNVCPNPYSRSSFLNKCFFWWLKDFVRYGNTHDLKAKDLYDNIPEDLSERLTRSLESVWMNEVNNACGRNNKPSLWKAVRKAYFWDFITLVCLMICSAIIKMVQPLLIITIMSYFRSKSSENLQWICFNATIFVVSTVLAAVCSSYSTFHLNRLGIRARIACSSIIYKKMMCQPSSTNQTIESSIVNLLTTDVAKLEVLFFCTPYIVILPIQLFVVTFLIWQAVGPIAATIAISLLILQTIPVQVLYSKMTLKFRAKQAAKTDNRISFIGEILIGIKTIKMYVWERYLEKHVYFIRKLEIANYMKMSYFTVIVLSLSYVCHRLSVFAIILINKVQDGFISVDRMLFTTLHLYNLRINLALFFNAVRLIIDMHVSMRRIQDFLLLQEIELSIQDNIDNNVRENIVLEGVTAFWSKESILFRNLSLKFAPNNLYVISGSVGSGKSSILKLILGELHPLSGNIFVRGRISYASQEPWLFNSSVKENILFGERYDEKRYNKVIEACALFEDFSQMPNGDGTLVGDTGSNLSGGQCARVNLARAVYRDADTYLFDDPLSAVDAQVAKKIINDCINGLLADKTRILVTHSLYQLVNVEEVIQLEHGRVKSRGNLEDCQQNEYYINRQQLDETKILEHTTKKYQLNEFLVAANNSIINERKELQETVQLISKKSIQKRVKKSVYLNYIKAGGWSLVSVIIVTNVLFIMAGSAFDFGVGVWTGNNESDNNTTDWNRNFSETDFSLIKKTMLTFGGLISLIIFTSIARSFCLYKFALDASKNIHNLIFSRLIKTKLQFFEENTAGEILNRFSEDTSIVDNNLPHAIDELVNAVSLIITLLLSAILANWWVLIPCSMSLITSLLVGKVFMRIIQKIKRLAGIARGPILSFATSSLAGVTTVRARRAEAIVLKEFNNRQDCYKAAQFLVVAVAQAFYLWVEFINVGFLISVTYLCIFLKNENTHEGKIGLTLMQILNCLMMISFVVKQSAGFVSYMISVERMLQFKELEPETVIENEPCLKLSSSWPDKGEIIFNHLHLRYSSDTDPVIWDINCKIEPNSKIGIVGRTGAGKSSLISALFRLAKFDGLLTIDGVDIKTIDLYQLRSKISIIPQEPVLFKSTLRKNLDPSDKFDDSTLWAALENVELKNIFNSLEFKIEKGGNNLSMGQRQLVCLARAIINKNKILILDEATANIDSATDTLIQTTLKSNFKDCTVLTIAHRLDTVMDSDKILVMDNGRIIEYDHPFVLLQKLDSHFSNMVQEMGDSTRQHFTNIAEQAYKNVVLQQQ